MGGRFKSQALLDEQALLACMVYVDLNPVRAGICETPEASDITSIQQRLQAYQDKVAHNQKATDSKTGNIDNSEETAATIQLNAFTGGFNTQKGVPFNEIDYFELTDWTGCAVHPKKKGSIPEGLPSLLARLGLSKENWIDQSPGAERRYRGSASRRTGARLRGGGRRGAYARAKKPGINGRDSTHDRAAPDRGQQRGASHGERPRTS